MHAKHSLASTASLIADPARAAMLMLLLDRRSFAAGELARAANISAQSASMHLAQLLSGGLVEVRREGRHRYYQIASAAVAHAVEALGVIASPRKRRPVDEDRAISYARTCYDHLAGALGVSIAQACETKGCLVSREGSGYELTSTGENFFAELSIDTAALRESRRIFARRCLDWTERRDHIAGALGAAICTRMMERRWIVRDNKTRVVHVTDAGRQEITRLFGFSRYFNAR